MENIFENAYFGKGFKTRDGRKAIFSRKDGDTFDLETEESYNPVRADGSFLYTKEGYESSCDIVSEWKEDIDELAIKEKDKYKEQLKFHYEFPHTENDINVRCLGYIDGFKDGYRKTK